MAQNAFELLYPELKPIKVRWVDATHAWLFTDINDGSATFSGECGQRVYPFLPGNPEEPVAAQLGITEDACNMKLYTYSQWRRHPDYKPQNDHPTTSSRAIEELSASLNQQENTGHAGSPGEDTVRVTPRVSTVDYGADETIPNGGASFNGKISTKILVVCFSFLMHESLRRWHGYAGEFPKADRRYKHKRKFQQA